MERILIVDDTLVGRRMLRLLLEQAGLGAAEITEASEGRQAWSLLSAGGFDLVVSDVYVPGMTGKELVERAGAQALGVPIIVVTADRSEELARELHAAGATAVLHKPCPPADFEAALAAARA